MDTVFEAVLMGKIETITEVLRNGTGETEILQARDNWGLSLLHWAVATGQRKTAAFLINRGADVNARSNNGWRPLKLAREAGDDEMVALLVKSGAKK